MLILYNCLIVPYLTYGNIIWGSTYHRRLNPLITKQKQAIRLVFKTNHHAHTRPIFTNLKLLNFTNISLYQTAIFMYKFHNNLLPECFNDYFALNDRIHDHDTRSSKNYHLSYIRTDFAKFSIKYQGSICWNSLPCNLKTSHSFLYFKTRFKMYLLELQEAATVSWNNYMHTVVTVDGVSD